MGDNQRTALTTLFDIYKQRPDLQNAYPEARTGDSLRLIEWAKGVCAKEWADSAFAVLKPHEKWYAAN